MQSQSPVADAVKMADTEATFTNRFRVEFKRYKQRKPLPDLSDVIDFENESSWNGRVNPCTIRDSEGITEYDLQQLGLQSLSDWRCFQLCGYKGFKVIVNPFTKDGALKLIQRCVGVYPNKPNICNLDAHMERNDKQNLWELYENTRLNKNMGEPLSQIAKKTQTLMDQLRWVTLGYHYNWDNKLYYKSNFTPFPEDLANLTKCIAKVTGYTNFVPEAAIINYYHMDSILSGHTDHSEFDLTAPLFSMSFGQTCIFLLGGKTLEDVPSAMFLRHGDVVVMADETRLAYHAVPRILPNNYISKITTMDNDDDEKCAILGYYLNYSRINVNIRQVEGPGGCFEPS